MPVSWAQFRAMRPVPDAIIINTNSATMTSETMPTLSVFRRFHASAQRPGETVCGISRAMRAGAFAVVPSATAAPFT